MSADKLYRLSGVSLFLGGLLTALGVIPMLVIDDDVPTPTSAAVALLRVVGVMLIVVGLPGLYARHAARAGVLGLFGFLLTLLYLLIMGVAGDTINAFVTPYIASGAPSLLEGPLPLGWQIYIFTGGLFGLVGGVMLGIAMLRAAYRTRWAGAALIAGSVLSFVGNYLLPPVGTLGLVMLLGSLAWLGLGVWSYREATGTQPERSPQPARA